MRTYKDYLDKSIELLEEHGVDNARGDAYELLEHFSGLSRTQYFMKCDDDMPFDEAEELFRATSKRAGHVPLQHILGYAYFYGRKFIVNENVLIPRFDTECVVEYALKNVESGAKVLDMCTGSGCIGITMALEKKLQVKACDVSEKALETAMENAKVLGAELELVKSDLFKEMDDEAYDMIVSNPPYIPTEVIATLSSEVKDHDPMLALDGSKDGLLFYRRIIDEGTRFLKTGGRFVFEIGSDQAQEVSELLKNAGFKNIECKKDLAGLDRIVSAVKC